MVTVEEPAFKLVQAGESVKLSCDGRSAAGATSAGSSQGPLTITWSSDTGRYAQSTGGVWELSNLEVEDIIWKQVKPVPELGTRYLEAQGIFY